LALWVKGFWISHFADSFGDLGRDYYIDNDGLCGFIGRCGLFDDFSLTVGFLYGLFSIFQFHLTL
jgi:hypothetical protein